MKKLVHSHKGVGQLETGTPSGLIVVIYEIGEYQDQISAASFDHPDATVEGLRSFRGVLRTKDGSHLPFGRPDLTLHLGDGRKLRILLPSVTGAHAEVQGTGGFF